MKCDNQNDFSSSRINNLLREIKIHEEEKAARLTMVEETRAELATLWDLLELPKSGSVAQECLFGPLKVSQAYIDRLLQKREELMEERQKRQKQVRDFAVQITLLWQRLKVSAEERDAFFNNQDGLGPGVLEAVRLLTYPKANGDIALV